MGASDFASLPHIGEALRRKEDYRFLTGAGQYTDDVTMAQPDATPSSCARRTRTPSIKSIDIAAAEQMPGVVGIFSGKDIEGKMGGLPCGWLINNPDGTPMKEPPHPILAHRQGALRRRPRRDGGGRDAWSRRKNAAEAVVVDYDVLPALVERGRRREEGRAASPSTTTRPTTSATSGRSATRRAVDAAFAKAAHVTKLDLVNNRLVPNAIEPRVAIGSYNRATEEYTLYVANQNPHVERLLMTAFVLGLPEHKVRVIAPDVGGGFGSKIFLYAEDVALTWAAKQLNRSIKWTGDRSRVPSCPTRTAATT